MPSGAPAKPGRSGALAVAAGILLSRIAGLVRVRAIAHYLGLSDAAAAFRAALQIPNLLQNLLGEGVLSASFIPVYARLLAEGRNDDARRVAHAVGTLLVLVAAVIALLGVVAAPGLVDIFTPGFTGDTRELTITLVRILFPGVALLVVSAWCLGVLNSHRRFFLSYVAPVVWNAAIVAAAIVAGRRFVHADDDVALWLAYGAVIGSAAQLAVQLPQVIALLRGLRPALALDHAGVRATLRAFPPVLLGRGSAQLSSYLDQVLASYLGDAVYTAMGNAQVLALLPVSLFGMSVSAAELPEMSSATGDDDARAAHLRARLAPALRRVVFLVVPSAIAFAAIGNAIVGLVFQSGRFGTGDTRIVWIILAGSAVGLSAATQSRLLGSAFYALGDPRTPLRAAIVRFALTGACGYAFALPLRDAFDYEPVWGAFGMTASAGVSAWIEFLLLRRWLAARIGGVPVPTRLGLGALAAALGAGAAGVAARWALAPVLPVAVAAAIACAVFGGAYVAVMAVAGVPEAQGLLRRITGRLTRGPR